MKSASIVKQERTDTRSAAVVEYAIMLCDTRGGGAAQAWTFMSSHSIDVGVISRVLAYPNQRRT